MQLKQPPIVYCDNVSAGFLTKHLDLHVRTNHIEIDFLFVREKVPTRQWKIQYAPFKG